MIREIYEYSIKNHLVKNQTKGFVERKIAAYIILNKSGELLGIEKIDKNDRVQKLCPDIGRKAQGTTVSNVICEKVNVIFSKSKKGIFYLEKLEEMSIREPLLKSVSTFLNNLEDIESFARKELNDIEKEYISFRVEDQNIEDLESWKPWYLNFYNEQYKGGNKGKHTLSLITGEEITPITLMDKVKGTGLTGTGDTLLSFFSPSFCSYKFKDCENAPLSQKEMEIINAGFEDLCKNHSNNIGESKLIHWYKESKDNDIIDEMLTDDESLFFGDSYTEEEKIDIKNRAAIELVKNVYNGKNAIIEENDIYYSFFIAANNGRIRILNNKEGSYTKLKENLLLWQEDTTLEKWDMILNRYLSPQKVFTVLLTKKSKDNRKEMKNEYGDNMIKLVYAIMDRKELPECFLYNAITNIKQSIYKDDNDNIKKNRDYYYQILKAYLIRKGDKNIMKGLNPDNPNVAYQCGRLFAMYELLQQEAMPNNSTSVLERYYGSASTTPAIIFGPLARQASIYYGKIDEKYKTRYQKIISEIGDHIPEFPKTLNIQEQAQFSLGYYQQRCFIFKKKEDVTSNKNNNKEEENNEK